MEAKNELVWDVNGQRFYELGISKGVLFPYKDGKYQDGVAWNGLTTVTESPSGADANDMYADDIKYASIRAAETFGGTIEAYTYPDEFAECDGSVEPVTGVSIGQQKRLPFGLSYVTKVGSDTDDELGYKLHLVYGATASPSEKSYQTINDSPEAITFSWEFTTLPVEVTNHKPTSCITIDSTKVTNKEYLQALEKVLYGSEEKKSRLPLPDEVIKILTDGQENP